MNEFTIKDNEKYGFQDLVSIMTLLRSENGCPWDREQTHESIRKNFIEEVYEACEAIDLKDNELLTEELGDVLLQVVFHAEIAREQLAFDITDVTDGVCRKLIVRHPHIFGDVKLKGGAAEVLSNWEKIKNETKSAVTTIQTLDEVAKSLPALMRAEKVVSRAMRGGEQTAVSKKYDFSSVKDADELGELLFEACRAAKRLGADPEEALERKTDEFIENIRKGEPKQ